MSRLMIILLTFLAGVPWAFGQRSNAGYFQMTYQNDYFTATDYYFTQGIRLELGAPFVGRSPLAPLLLRFSTDPSSVLHRFLVAQDGYTPTSIRVDTILRGDRPYAGALYLGQKAISLREEQGWRLSSEILLGVIGPWALSGEEQEYIHRKTGNVMPRGWQYQIANDLLVNYNLELDKQLVQSRLMGLSGGVHTWLGTYRSRVGLQSKVAFGWVGNDFRRNDTGKWQLFLFAEGRMSLIGYDATLQGGFFNRSSVYTLPARNVNRLLASYEAGVHFRLGKLQLVFSHTYLSREIRNGRNHAWGTARIRIGF